MPADPKDIPRLVEAIDHLLDGVADYVTITRPTKADFAKLEAVHAQTAAEIATAGLTLPPIDEAGLPVFVVFPIEGASYHTGWTTETPYSPERLDRWRQKVRDVRNRIVFASEPPSVDDEDERILRTLAAHAPRRLTQDQIEANSGVSRRTISPRIQQLLADGLVSQPKGPNRGTTITEKGWAVLKQIDAAKRAQ
jgi:hypothetical protein